MNQFDQLTPEEDEIVAQLVERMQRAGWIDKVMWTADNIQPHVTKLGRQRFREIYQVVAELQPDKMKQLHPSELLFILRLAILDREGFTTEDGH